MPPLEFRVPNRLDGAVTRFRDEGLGWTGPRVFNDLRGQTGACPRYPAGCPIPEQVLGPDEFLALP